MVFVPQSMAATVVMGARRGEAQGRAGGLDPRNDTVGEDKRLSADIGDIGMVPDVERGFQRGQLQNGRRADAHPFDASAGAVGCIKGKGCFVAKPAGKRRAGFIGMAGGYIDKGRAAGAGIEVFVGTTDRKIDVAGGKMHWEGPGGMRKIPDG